MRKIMMLSFAALAGCAAPSGSRTGAPIYRIAPSAGFPYKLSEIHNSALPQSEFKQRRSAFAEYLRGLGAGTVAIAKSAPVAPRNGDVEHEYRQDSDFYWLTGFHEPESIAIIDADAAANGGAAYTLIVQPRDPLRETWTGKRVGPDRAKSDYFADAAFAKGGETEKFIEEKIVKASTVVIVNNFDKEFTKTIDDTVSAIKKIGGKGPAVVDGRKWIAERRLIKSPGEIEMLKKCCEVTIEGHLAAMRAARPGMNEGEVEAAAEFAFRAIGGPRLGYPSIAGGGNNGCVLHYTTNNEWLGQNALMLLDAATEVGFYTADVTRTWPVNGKFTNEQLAIYNIVLDAQNAGIAKCVAGAPVHEVHDAAVLKVTEGLVKLGILKGDVPTLIQQNAHRKYFMHGTSHWLGLDVHDAGDYQTKNRKLEPGMFLTVEPGIYIPEGTDGIDKKWWGIGVRIEDDILVTDRAPLNLSGRLPRDPMALEKLVRDAHAQN
ncbi:MAG: aminopeptidase P N-terminal domain-containing protein [Planctomycetes bacterium]|nr:aminopeptidase P N-terminal domain-containing protein [Planctomycetota bacterium]